MTNDPPPAVLVTGASTGIGWATAELLAAQGYRILAGVRRRVPADPLPPVPPGCEPIELDVTSADNVARAASHLGAELPGGLFALVNNAGMAPPAAVELADVDEFRRVLEVNAVAPLRLIQVCLPLLRRGRGRIINMSSMNGTVSLPIVGAYSASKFALEALSNALRVELRPWGIPVTVIRPGQIRTPIFDKAGAFLEARATAIPEEMLDGYADLYARAVKFNARGARAHTGPDAVARTVLRALRARRPKSRYYVGLDAVGLQIAYEWLPTRLMDWIFAAVMGVNRRASDAESLSARPSGPFPLEGRAGEEGGPAKRPLAPLDRTAPRSPLSNPPHFEEGAGTGI
jgi:NAD(P)-dependent dehydrogenase (short-subunit alcohol dehydrogenase family)